MMVYKKQWPHEKTTETLAWPMGIVVSISVSHFTDKAGEAAIQSCSQKSLFEKKQMSLSLDSRNWLKTRMILV